MTVKTYIDEGYSGKPERDLTNGFTVAGSVYGNQMPYLERCFSNGWPVGSNAEDVFTDEAIDFPDDDSLIIELPAYGVKALRFSKGQ